MGPKELCAVPGTLLSCVLCTVWYRPDKARRSGSLSPLDNGAIAFGAAIFIFPRVTGRQASLRLHNDAVVAEYVVCDLHGDRESNSYRYLFLPR